MLGWSASQAGVVSASAQDSCAEAGVGLRDPEVRGFCSNLNNLSLFLVSLI